MAKIKFGVKENKRMGTHSFFAVPQLNGTLTYDELVTEAAEKTTYEKSVVRACIDEYMNAVQKNVLKGFRCPVGQAFLTVYPNIQANAKDYTDKESGELVVATAAMVTARNAKSRLGCTVHADFSDEFEKKVSWQKVDQTGASVEEEDINDANPDNDPNADINPGGGTNTPSDNTGGGNNGNYGFDEG